MSEKKPAYVLARMANVERTRRWCLVEEAESLEQAIKIVEQRDDVEVVLEASWIPGGVVT